MDKLIKNMEIILDNNYMTESYIKLSARYDFKKCWEEAFGEVLPSDFWRYL